MLTGSWYCVPEKANWIERYWFEPLQKLENTHINSGHMIISRAQFNELQGFNDKLETAEDYDISMRAKKLGICIVDNHDLRVVHEGYPKNIKEFMQREYWHGKGDAISLKAIIKSKVASLSIIFIMLHIGLLLSLLVSLSPVFSYVSIIGIVFMSFSASYIKYRRESLGILCINTIFYYFYFFARAASSLTSMFNGQIKKRQR